MFLSHHQYLKMSIHITSKIFKLLPNLNYHLCKLTKLKSRFCLWRKINLTSFFIQTKFKKNISNLVSPTLSIILNNSLTTVFFFPKSLNTARVVPMFKAGDRNTLNHYRPSSIPPFFSKTFKIVVQICSSLDFFFISQKRSTA